MSESISLWAQPYGSFSTFIGTSSVEVFDAENQQYRLSPNEEKSWLFTRVSGNFIASAEVIVPPSSEKGQAGWKIKAGSFQFSGQIQKLGKVLASWQTEGEAPEYIISAPKRSYQMIQVERDGQTIILRAALKGEPLQEIARVDQGEIATELELGIFHHGPSESSPVVFHNLRLDLLPDTPPARPQAPGAEGSRLEILDVFSGKRTVVHSDKNRFEAPNWLPDGKHLLYNQEGKLWKIPVSVAPLPCWTLTLPIKTTMITAFLLTVNSWPSAIIARICPMAVRLYMCSR